MNGYDFDKTIYDGDSSTDFFWHMVLTRTYLLLFFPWFLIVVMLYGFKVLSQKKTKECLFFFIPWYKKGLDEIVEKFWDKRIDRVFDWYKAQQKEDDLIISASLDFVLMPAIRRLGIKNCLCTLYNRDTGKIIGENCYGKQKYVRFKAKFLGEKLKSFYSDSMSDFPMMKIADEAFLVKKKQPISIVVPK